MWLVNSQHDRASAVALGPRVLLAGVQTLFMLSSLQATADAGARIVEPDLVALGAISLADRALLAPRK